MSLNVVKEYLREFGADKRILEFETSSATVELAAQAAGCEVCRIAKTLSFDCNGETILIVTSGDCKIDNAKYKHRFLHKAKMLSADEVETRVGHAPGGVCPFGVNSGVKVCLDISLRRFATVYPACGSSNSAIEVSPDELEQFCKQSEWVDVCKV